MNTHCSIDWLSITTRHERGAITPRILTDSYLQKRGRLGYKVAHVFQNGITHLWSDDRPEIHVIYSGETLKTISEIMSIRELVQWHEDLGHRVSRIDTAVDVFDSNLLVTAFSNLWKKGNVKTRAKSAILISDPRNETGDTFYVGSLKKRRKLLRIYDKGKEQQVNEDWIRFEMQWGSGAARTAAKQISECESLSTVIKSQMIGYCDFNNEVWREVFAKTTPLKVSHDLPHGLSNRERWLYNVVLPALTQQEKETPGIAETLVRMVHEKIHGENQRDRQYIKK